MELPSLVMSDDVTQLVTALDGFQTEMQPVPKNKRNPFYESRYADLGAIVEAAAPVLRSHGLSVLQIPGMGDRGPTLWTWLFHTSGQFIGSPTDLLLAKDDPQAQGSAITYMRRYAYSTVLGIITEEDDDGNSAATSQQNSSKRQASSTKAASDKQVEFVKKLVKEIGWDEETAHRQIDATVGRVTNGWSDLTAADASTLIEHLIKLKENTPQSQELAQVGGGYGESEEPF